MRRLYRYSSLLLLLAGLLPAGRAAQASASCAQAFGAAVAAASSRPAFWRIISDRPRPADPARLAELVDFFGTEHLLFEDELQSAPTPPTVDGYVWYDRLDQVKLVRGSRGSNAVESALPWHRIFSNDKGADIEKVFERYVPEAIARSRPLPELLARHGLRLGGAGWLPAFQAALRSEFPGGFVIKINDGYDSRGQFPDERSDMAAVLARYRQDYLPRVRELLAQGRTAADAQDELNGRPGFYEGMILDTLARGHADRLYAEEKLAIATGSARREDGVLKVREKEYRVIVDENGRVLTSQHRWDERRLYDEAEAREAAAFVQAVAGRIPREMHGPSGWDVVKLTDGSWRLLERNIWEVGGWDPELNTLTANLLAERIQGSTPLQDAFRRFLSAPSLDEKERLYADFLARDGIRPLLAERHAITEYLLGAKTSFMQSLREDPTTVTAERVIGLAAKFGLGDQFSAADLEFLGGLLLEGGRPLEDLSPLLGPFDLLSADASGHVRLALTDYDDTYVEHWLDSRLASGPREPARVQALVEETVVGGAQAAAQPGGARLSRSGDGGRWVYRGDPGALVRGLIDKAR